MSDDMSELGGENEGVPASSASSVSNDLNSELAAVMSETEDSNSCLEPSSSETDSYHGTGCKVKDDASCKSSSSDLTVSSSTRDGGDDGAGSGARVKFPVRPGIAWRKGERLEAEDYQRNWYTSKIMNIDEEKKFVLIHFEGWNQRYDEWMEMDSDRLRPLTRHSERRDKRRKGKTVYRPGDQVLAKWTDCKMYLAKVDEVMNDGSYMVVFYDGFRKNIQPINLRPATTEQKLQKFQIKPPVLSPKDLKNIKTKPVDFKVTDEKHAPGYKAGKLKGKASVPGTSTGQTTEKPKPAKPPTHPAGAQKKSKLIVSGSLFSKKMKAAVPADTQHSGTVQKRIKDGLKAKLKQEGKAPVEEVKEKEDVKPTTEEIMETEAAAPVPAPAAEPAAAVPPPKAEETEETKVEVTMEVAQVGESQVPVHVAVSASLPKKPVGRKRQRAGSFPGEKRRRRKGWKGPKPLTGCGITKKAKSTDAEKLPTSPVLAPLLPPVPHVPSKAFLVEEDHNPFKCDECGKGFRKKQLLADHIKHYHKPEGPHLTPSSQPRKRKKTLSTCSTDSDMSLSSKSASAKRRRHISEVSVGSPELAMRMSFDEETMASALMAAEGLADSVAVVEGEDEGSDEVVNCICGLREETGTMIQCDCCQCWQHTQCCGFTDEDLASDTFLSTYICFVCKHPPGVRESGRYLYDMDWFRKGQLPGFSFVPTANREDRHKEIVTTHHLLAQLMAVNKVMHGLREHIALTGEKEHAELRLWHQPPPKESRSVGVSTSDLLEPEPLPPDTKPPVATQPPAPSLDSHREVSGSQQPQAGGEAGCALTATPLQTHSSGSATPLQTHSSGSATPLQTHSSGSATPLQTHSSGSATPLQTHSSGSATPLQTHSSGSASSQLGGAGSTDQAAHSAGVSAAEHAGPQGSDGVKQASDLAPSQAHLDQTLSTPTHAADCTVTGGAEAGDSGGGAEEGSVGGPGKWWVGAGSKPDREGDTGGLTAGPEAEVKTDLLDTSEEQDGDEAVTTVHHDPFAECKLSVLTYVKGVHDDLSHQLDELEMQITAVERQEFGMETAGCYSNIPAIKHSLYRLVRDLNKVKVIASYR